MLKEIKKSAEMKMFLEFAPQYFDYMCKSFFHNYPCARAKILGAYKVVVFNHTKNKQEKRYFFLMENLNLGISNADEIVRYDLKGSTKRRFVPVYSEGQVLLDNNFLLDHHSKPVPIVYNMRSILKICINNDSLFLAKSNIVDYSLLAIINKTRKTIRFGIIDYI